MIRNNLKNRYAKNARISERKFKDMLRCFCLDIEANKAAVLARANRNTINRYYQMFRYRIADFCEAEFVGKKAIWPTWTAIHEIDKDARQSIPKNQAFGIICHNHKVYAAELTSNPLVQMSSPPQGGADEDSVVYDHIQHFDGILDFDRKCFLRICVGRDQADKARLNHQKNSAELFWRFVKNRLFKFNGVSKTTLYYHIKECEFRYNNRNKNLYRFMLKMLRTNPLE